MAEAQHSVGQFHSMDLSLPNMDSRRRVSSPVAIPARSGALIMEEFLEDSPLAGSRASADSTAVAGGGNALSFLKATYELEREIMHTTNLTFETFSKPTLKRIAALAALALLVIGHAKFSIAQKQGRETFSSPGEAGRALFQAVKNEDEEAVESILGTGKEVTSSSDATEDRLERERFIQKYQEMHRLVREPDGTTVLYIGAENWPFPVPLLSKNGAWYFDSDAGAQEILFRTVGENETTAIQVCHAVVKAKEPGETEPAGDEAIRKYVQSLVGGGTATAVRTAGKLQKESSPFHGYYFRVVTNSSVSRKRTGAVVLVAYPAEYRSSGVMTFIVTKDGTVYEKDLGTKGAGDAKKVVRGPDSSWHIAEQG